MKHFLPLFILLVFTPVVFAIDEVTTMPDFTDIPPDVQAFYYGETILGDEWLLFFTNQDEFQVNVAWQNDGAVVIVSRMEFFTLEHRDDYLDDIDNYIDDIMAQYSPYTIEKQCPYGNAILYQMDAINNGNDYLVNYYARSMDNMPEAWFIGIYFPVERADELEPTSALFFPDFISCQPMGDA